jgi:hypothetical protein
LRGSALFKDLSVAITECYVSVERQDFNNWSAKTKISLKNASNQLVCRIDDGKISNKVAGRSKKKWKQTYQMIAQTTFRNPCEDFQRLFVFKRDLTYEIYVSAECAKANTDQPVGIDTWAINDRNTSINIGPDDRPTLQKRVTFIELTDTKMRYFYFPLDNKDSPVRIEEEFVAVE